MNDHFRVIVADKILTGWQAPRPVLTRRDRQVPTLPQKAMTVIGMRRSGKTCFLHQVRADRIAAGESPQGLVYFNFEDERLAGMQSSDLDLIPTTHHRLHPESADAPATYFLDEIQLVPGWERFARRLLDEGSVQLFLSGSSAKLLSREIATAMRGRGWEIAIHPFSFHEYLSHHDLGSPGSQDRRTLKQQAVLDRRFADYLDVGGFPEAQSLEPAQRRQLLLGYVDVLMLRDVIERHHLSNVTALRWMIRRLLGNPGSLFSVTKFEAELKSQGIAAGRETLYEMLAHLEDAFLLKTVGIATDSEKRRQINPRKVYPVDPALGPVFDRSPKQNLGHALEVAVHNDLIRRGAETAYVRTREGYEVDFLTRNPDGTQWLVQVCADPGSAETRARECRALRAAAREHPADRQLLLTAESRLPFPDVPAPIEVIPAWQWMLESHPES